MPYFTKPISASDALLLASVSHGAVAMARHALACGANPDARYPDGDSVLHRSAAKANGGLVTALLAAGANRSMVNRLGATAASIAVQNKSTFIANKLRA